MPTPTIGMKLVRVILIVILIVISIVIACHVTSCHVNVPYCTKSIGVARCHACTSLCVDVCIYVPFFFFNDRRRSGQVGNPAHVLQ